MFHITGDKQQQSPQKQQQTPLTNGNSTPASSKKKKNKENASAPSTPNNATPNKQADGKTPKKIVEGGVIVEEIKVGTGVPAKSGKMVRFLF